MKKVYLILTSAALAAFSAGATWYLLQNPVAPRRGGEERIQVGPAEPEKVVSPELILVKPAQEPEQDDSNSFPGELVDGDDLTTAVGGGRAPAVDPQWEPGTARIEGAEPVTEHGAFTRPRWSPVGLDLAFTRGDGDSIWISGTRPGGQARLLADDPGVGKTFLWNLDGMSIHSRSLDGQPMEILITGEKYPAAEHPDRVFEERGRIWLRLTEDEEPVAISGPEDLFGDPVLSPDETKVVYRGRETGLYMAAADGSRTIRVGRGENPAWLPDSSGIVFDRPVYDDQGPVDGDIWYASADGRELTNLTKTPGVLERHPHVAPDGQRIAYARDGAIYVAGFKRGEP